MRDIQLFLRSFVFLSVSLHVRLFGQILFLRTDQVYNSCDAKLRYFTICRHLNGRNLINGIIIKNLTLIEAFTGRAALLSVPFHVVFHDVVNI